MKCLKCNYENIEGSRFCQSCGNALSAPQPAPEAPVQSAPEQSAQPTYTAPVNSAPSYTMPPQYAQPMYAQPVNPAAQRIISVLNDPLYLVLCILLSVAALNFAVVTVIIAICSWICYAAAKKGGVNSNNLRTISGAVYADYIITLVAGWILVGAGAIFAILFLAASAVGNVNLNLYDIPFDFGDYLGNIPTAVVGVLGVIIGFLLVAIGVGVVIITRLGLKKIHGFAKSVYKSIENGVENYEYAGAVQGWLIAHGIMAAVNVVTLLTDGEILSALAMGALAAAGIIAFMLVKKHFSNVNN